MGLYVGNTKYKVMSGGSPASFMYANPLPYDAKIEYLESTGTQYIATGIQPSAGDVLSYDVVVQYSSGVVSNTWLTGWYVSGSNSSLFGTYQNQIHFTYNRDNNAAKTATGLYDKNRIRFNVVGGIYINDTLLSSTVANNTPLTNVPTMDNGLMIFKRYIVNFTDTAIKAKIFSFTILINQVVVFDAIPVRVGTTGYMYDRVSGQLFGNSGTGDFVLGPDV